MHSCSRGTFRRTRSMTKELSTPILQLTTSCEDLLSELIAHKKMNMTYYEKIGFSEQLIKNLQERSMEKRTLATKQVQ